MFEAAFKALGAEDSREIVKEVKGKEVREKIGGSLYNITNLKDRIVTAQRVANLMLKYRSPVGFYPELGGAQYIKAFQVLENTEQVRTFIKETYADKYGESQINVAINTAKNVLGARYRGETLKNPSVFEIGYRPDPARLADEKNMLGEAQKMLVSNLIKSEEMKNIINANVEKWKLERDMHKPNSKLNRNVIEKKWIEADKKFAESYKDYSAAATEDAVKAAREQYDMQKKEKAQQIQVKLDEPKAQIVPPVQSKPVSINPPQIDK
jgi:hypothetical protein